MAPRWVAILAVVLIGVQLALLATFRRPSLPVAAATAPAAARTSAVDLPAILRANLFGRSAAPAADGANAPVTRLALALTGVIATTRPEDGFAILGQSATATRLYAAGSTLPGGVRLHSVYPDRVLLDIGGSLEALPLPKRDLANLPPPPPPPAASALDRVQQLVREQPGIIGEILRPQAVIADGRQRGYRVYPGPNQRAFNRLGLRPGDLVTAINGTTLDDPNRGGEIFSTLASVAEATVTVERNGTTQDVVLNLADVANAAEDALNPNGQDTAAGQPGLPPASR